MSFRTLRAGGVSPIGRISGRHNYNRTRTHLSLAKDAPESRSVQPPSQGRGWQCHASVGFIMNACGRHREPTAQ